MSGKAASKRIMLVIPGRLFRNGIELVLRGVGGDIIGDCETLAEAAAALAARPDLQPDLFVVGMREPEQLAEDFAQISALRGKYPTSRLIVLSSRGGAELWWQAVESRVDGLLHQDSPGEVLQLLVRLILLGYSFLPSSLEVALKTGMPTTAGIGKTDLPVPEASLYTMFSVPERPATPGTEGAHRWRAGLSDRESDILRGLVVGSSNKLIARELNISEATVKVHVKALLRKMQVTNRTQAAISALQFLNNPSQAKPVVPARMPPPTAGEDDPAER